MTDHQLIDLSEYVVGIDVATEPDETALTWVRGVRDCEPITITGRWEPSAVVRFAFDGKRAPRKSKKAFLKLVNGASIRARERRRISRLRFVFADLS